MNPKKLFGILAVTAMTVSVLLLIGAIRQGEAVTWAGTHISPPMPASPFTLASADGDVSLASLRGKALSSALETLGPAREDVQVVFVSVDPERDTPERATAYAKAVDPSFLGLTGSPGEIADVAAKYGIYYAKAEGSDATGYLVDHSATVTVLNRDGRVELLWSPTVTAGEMASDLAALLD
ncbi:MAG: SCO family protein [Gemmatimonadota bacterium]